MSHTRFLALYVYLVAMVTADVRRDCVCVPCEVINEAEENSSAPGVQYNIAQTPGNTPTGQINALLALRIKKQAMKETVE